MVDDGRLRVLLVDDNPLFRAGLATLLAEHPSIEVVGTAQDGLEAVAEAERLRPDVVLMDVNMPQQGGISTSAVLAARLPSSRVILLTGLAAEQWVYDPRQVGVHACLSKSAAIGEIVEAVLDAGRDTRAARPSRPQPRGEVLPERLTPRELDILRLIGQGRRSGHIARELRLQPKTIQNYITVIYEKLGIHGRSEAVRHAARNGLLDDLT